ncbi:MAG: MFS transporter [Pseudomonadota bacterium]
MSQAPLPPDQLDDIPPEAASHMGGSAQLIGTSGAFSKSGMAWVIFELARNPYYNLIVVYIFATYFAEQVAGGGAQGFATASLVGTIAGMVAAPTSPILGLIADQAGRRKPAIAIFLTMLGTCAALLWFSKPEGQGGLGVPLTMLILVVGYCSYTYSETLHNAMLPSAARPSAVPLLSGMALASANFASVGMFIAFLALLALPAVPAFGLDKDSFEHIRIVGPFIAIWLAIFIIPFFLFMPDFAGTGVSWKQATRRFFRGTDAAPQTARQRFGVFIAYVKSLWRDENNATRFLLARTIYADGMHALLFLSAVYVVTFLDWNPIEMTLFAIMGLLFGGVGGLVGGILDRVFGCRVALNIEIMFVVILAVFQLSITQESILYGLIPGDTQVWSGELFPGTEDTVFPTLSDLAYACAIIPGAIAIVAVIASSRSMLVHVAPPARIGEFFGLYAIAGTVTVWMGPGLVSVLTALSGSQRVGMAGIGILFFAGLAVLQTVKDNPVET